MLVVMVVGTWEIHTQWVGTLYSLGVVVVHVEASHWVNSDVQPSTLYDGYVGILRSWTG